MPLVTPVQVSLDLFQADGNTFVGGVFASTWPVLTSRRLPVASPASLPLVLGISCGGQILDYQGLRHFSASSRIAAGMAIRPLARQNAIPAKYVVHKTPQL